MHQSYSTQNQVVSLPTVILKKNPGIVQALKRLSLNPSVSPYLWLPLTEGTIRNHPFDFYTPNSGSKGQNCIPDL